jgi:hypothetical protein
MVGIIEDDAKTAIKNRTYRKSYLEGILLKILWVETLL